jgi:CRP-like cAMP-binding protein
VHCIRSGRVKLYKMGRKGEPQVIRLLGAGDILGYRPALAGETYAATAEAVETASICAIPRTAFLEALRRSPDLALRLMALMARELRVSEEQLLAQAQETVRQRTARTLVDFLASGAEDKRGGQRITLPLRRRELAQLVGTTPETLTRTLKLLERKGLLHLTRSEIYVPDPAALKRIASRVSDRD